MTTLEVVDTAESQAAVAYLLNLVMKRYDLNTRIFSRESFVVSEWLMYEWNDYP